MSIPLGFALAAMQNPPPYAEAIRCAGLVEAASNLVPGNGAEGRKLYDAAIFWGMAASEAGQKEGLTSARFTADQKSQRELALTQLNTGDAAAKGELTACLARVPAL